MRLLPEETLQTPEVCFNANRLVKKKGVRECVCTRRRDARVQTPQESNSFDKVVPLALRFRPV